MSAVASPCSSAAAVTSVTAGLGFVHLSAGSAKFGGAAVRGAPRGEPAADAPACCALCLQRPGCSVWLHRSESGKCFLGKCATESRLPCLEQLRTPQQASSQVQAGVGQSREAVLLCHRPPGVGVAGRERKLATAGVPKGRRPVGGLALLLLGHRNRLMFETLPSMVVAPVVASGTPVDFFAFLENSTMLRAFRGRRPLGNPSLAPLSDVDVARQLSDAIETAGGRTAAVYIGPRPPVTLPIELSQRLSRYSQQVKLTVATRLVKEHLGLEMLLAHERSNGGRYAWVLWTREDSHWFMPFDLQRFQRGAVHGKACGGFGGWNDKVWLMDREWAPRMLSMYDALQTPYQSSCTDLAATTGSGTTAVDFLAAPSVEQFRERVGKLYRIPFTKHPPDDLPTMDSYYLRDGTSWKLCFPRIYANGCVPRINQSTVDAMSCA